MQRTEKSGRTADVVRQLGDLLHSSRYISDLLATVKSVLVCADYFARHLPAADRADKCRERSVNIAYHPFQGRPQFGVRYAGVSQMRHADNALLYQLTVRA